MDVELGELESNEIHSKFTSEPDVASAEGTGLLNLTFDHKFQPQTLSQSAPDGLGMLDQELSRTQEPPKDVFPSMWPEQRELTGSSNSLLQPTERLPFSFSSSSSSSSTSSEISKAEDQETGIKIQFSGTEDEGHVYVDILKQLRLFPLKQRRLGEVHKDLKGLYKIAEM